MLSLSRFLRLNRPYFVSRSSSNGASVTEKTLKTHRRGYWFGSSSKFATCFCWVSMKPTTQTNAHSRQVATKLTSFSKLINFCSVVIGAERPQRAEYLGFRWGRKRSRQQRFISRFPIMARTSACISGGRTSYVVFHAWNMANPAAKINLWHFCQWLAPLVLTVAKRPYLLLEPQGWCSSLDEDISLKLLHICLWQ